MTVCVDANIIVRYLAPETGTPAATRWFEAHEQEELIAPALATAEVATALLKKVRYGQITEAYRVHALRVLGDMDLRLVWSHWLIERASELAVELGQMAIYDSLYLALAESEQCDVWTADARFARAASPKYPRVRLLV